MRKVAKFTTLILLIVFTTMACTDSQPRANDDNRKESVAQRGDNYERAKSVHPAPTNLSNFPQRGALVEFEIRKDMVNHPWYVYIMGMDGTPVGYYIGKTYPINACNFLSDTTQFVDLPDGQWGVTSAPSYDGIYYGGGGSSANCNSYFFFDVNTDAMHTFVAPMWFASDRPLNLDVPRLGTEGETDDPVATPAD